ncbi:MAG: ABC transporter permease subunit [Thermomicrobiales bacterium]|nr:ABC transporter permease subunit [Thermomicrobiales bacterium]
MATPPLTQPAPTVTPRGRSKRARRDMWFAIALMLPTLIAVIGVSVYPVGYAIWTSLHNVNPSLGMNSWAGLDNYTRVLGQENFQVAFRNTMRFAGSATVLTLLLGMLMALVLNQPFFGRGLMRSIVLVPWAISGTVVGILWFWIYDGGYGTLNGVLFKLGLIDSYQAWLSDGDRAMNLVVVAYVWNSAPMAALFFLAALQSVPGNLYSAAKMDGAGIWQRFRYITLPWLRPILVLVLLLSTINGVMAFDLIYFLTRGGPGISTTVFSWLGYNTIFSFFQFGQGTAILLILTMMCLVLAFLYMYLLDRQPRDAKAGPDEATNLDLEDDLERRSRTTMQIAALSRKGERPPFTAGRHTWLNSRSGRAWKGRLIYLPVAIIAIWSLAPVTWLLIMSLSPFTDLLSKPPAFWPDFTFQNYRNIFTGQSSANTAGVPMVATRVPNALLNSTIVAGSVTIVCLLLGSMAGYSFSRFGGESRFLRVSLLGMMMTRMVPGIAIMVPWFLLFRNLGLSNTKTGLVISYASFSIPLVLWILKCYFDTVPRNLERAAAIDGCGRIETFIRIVLPLAAPGLVAAGLFAFIMAWNEFIFALNLAQSDTSMTITYVIAQIYGVAQYGQQNYGTLFASGILAILPPIALAFLFQRRLVQGLTAGSVKG